MITSWRAVLVAGGLMSVVAPAPALASRHSGHRTHESSHALFVSAARGSDANACSAPAPCKTIGRAVGLAHAGDEVVVQRGSYPESVTINKRVRLSGQDATINATGKVNGLVISGPGAAGTEVDGLRVENGIGEGILVVSTSRIVLERNAVENNDQGHDTPVTQECTTQGDVPGDCGEALHLMGVADSRVVGNLIDHNIGGILITDETGPSRGNLIAHNVSRDNGEDCGITLPSHNPDAVAHPSQAGVHDNWVIGNVSVRNGGAGVGMFAPAPGTASYDNHVIGNITRDNGEAGIAIHAHAPGQNVSGNVIVGNRVSGNGIDPDSGSGHPTGIALFSAASPATVTVAHNQIRDEYFGIFIAGPIAASGLSSNQISRVTVAIGHP
ncbi:MAG: right-handed parallel beta-helix repeat-containing protein [Solirubrobacterales bacterium]|nr:right-handed parallel beta-helix repeat-containing protein [Solirubrobacterales bacterium]